MASGRIASSRASLRSHAAIAAARPHFSGAGAPGVNSVNRFECGGSDSGDVGARYYGIPGFHLNASPSTAIRPTPGYGKCGENTTSWLFARRANVALRVAL